MLVDKAFSTHNGWWESYSYLQNDRPFRKTLVYTLCLVPSVMVPRPLSADQDR